MKNPTVGIVGMGVVGNNIMDMFPWASGYDRKLEPFFDFLSLHMVTVAEFCFICVPTPMGEKGNCDISMVEEVVKWLEAKIIIIKSTVEIGTTDRLAGKYHKQICFSPEFMGATQHSRPKNNFVILGGDSKTTKEVARLYQHASDCYIRIHQTDSKTAELTKYMENAFLANKVVFCNEMYRISEAFGINYNELRELFLLDSRMSPSHTFVYEKEPYYNSKCFNKDLPALIACSERAGFDPKFIKAIVQRNSEFKAE